MPIYWTFFSAPFIIRGIQIVIGQKNEIVNQKKQDTALLILVFALIIFFIGMRSGVADTGAYISSYKALPDDIHDFDYEAQDKDALFSYLSCLFKSVTKASYQYWLFSIALICGVAVARGIYKYSSCVWLSCYLFVATTDFTYMLNGMRQFIPMAILFCNADLVVEKKYIRYVLLTAILAQIHASAWFMLLLIPLSRFKPWSIWMFAIIAAGCVFAVNFDSFAETVDSVLENTQYSGIGETISNGNGSNVLRFFVSAVPPIIAFLARERVEKENSRLLNMIINCSVMGMTTMIISTFTFGILVGRVAAYFNIFNMVLLPWLVTNVFEKKNRRMVLFALLVLYGIYFYYQMCVAWHMFYVSEVLGLRLA